MAAGGNILKLPVLPDALVFAYGKFCGIDKGNACAAAYAARHNKHHKRQCRLLLPFDKPVVRNEAREVPLQMPANIVCIKVFERAVIRQVEADKEGDNLAVGQAGVFFACQLAGGGGQFNDAVVDILFKVDTIFICQKENFGNLVISKHVLEFLFAP